ncbi:LysR family transcriptional regulator [Sphingomonas koreensis]|nr:LysR family transcriptional regulator [Sphingomonas koreensis]
MTTVFDLNLRHLRALSTIVAQGSMSAAANAVGLSQPALTQGLAKLERSIGVELFERRSDGVSPTPAGLALAARVDTAFDLLAQTARTALRARVRGFGRPETRMTATQMNAFLQLFDAGSFVDAARATGLSVPAIHRAVRDLEQICGVALVERRGRGVTPTAAGRQLTRGLRLAASEIAAGLSEVAGEAGQPGRIAIGAMPLSRALVLPHALGEFLRRKPNVAVEVFEGSWRDLVEPLRDGVIDLMIGALRDEAPVGLEQRPLFEDRLVVVARAGHPLTRTGAPSLQDLARYGWVVGQAGSPLRTRWEAVFRSCPAPPSPLECGSVMVIRGVLMDSDLLTLLSPDQIALEVRSGLLAAMPLPSGGAVRTIGITTRSNWRPTDVQQRFLDHLVTAVNATRFPKNQ